MIYRREFLLLAHTYKNHKINPDWFWSIKLDGMRAFWDGGISIGVPCSQVPWANTAKDGRYLETRIATGMWSRLGKPIYIPEEWQEIFPKHFLDGELWSGIGEFEKIMSTAKDLTPGDDWKDINYYVFDIPPITQVTMPGRIAGTNVILDERAQKWVLERKTADRPCGYAFHEVVDYLASLDKFPALVPLAQRRIGDNDVNKILDEMVDRGHEGIMLRDPNDVWQPQRRHSLLKMKKSLDAEGIVVGYTFGRETDKGSKLLGMMGALTVEWRGTRFDLSGFTDEERILENIGTNDAQLMEGMRCPEYVRNLMFPLGSKVSFKYNETSKDGVPRFARYWRKA